MNGDLVPLKPSRPEPCGSYGLLPYDVFPPTTPNPTYAPNVLRLRANASAQLHRANARLRLLKALDPWCVMCGETDTTVLVVDHRAPLLDGGGRDVRATWVRVRKGRESPFNLQVLCANDHARKTRGEVVLYNDTTEVGVGALAHRPTYPQQGEEVDTWDSTRP
jgi:hypothetical protein